MSAHSADATEDTTEGVTEGGTTLDIVLTKAGRTKIRYPAQLLSDDGTHVTVRAPWAAPGVRDFGFVRFEPGDVFIEHYWRDLPHSLKGMGGAPSTPSRRCTGRTARSRAGTAT